MPKEKEPLVTPGVRAFLEFFTRDSIRAVRSLLPEGPERTREEVLTVIERIRDRFGITAESKEPSVSDQETGSDRDAKS